MEGKVLHFPKLHIEEQKVLEHLHQYGTTIPEILENIQKENVEWQKKADAVRHFLQKLSPVTRVYLEYSTRYGRYYTAQYFDAPGYLAVKVLKTLSNNKFTIKRSRIFAGADGALLHPGLVKSGYRINVYLN